MIAILGTGKMGEALLSGLLRAGRPPSNVIVAVRREERGTELSERYGVQPRTPPPPRRWPAPWSSRSSRRTWGGCWTRSLPRCLAGTLVISVAAGITTSFIYRRLATSCPWSGSCRTRLCWWTRR